MGKSSRPKNLFKAQECVKCHRRTQRICSNGVCSICDIERFNKEFKPQK